MNRSWGKIWLELLVLCVVKGISVLICSLFLKGHLADFDFLADFYQNGIPIVGAIKTS